MKIVATFISACSQGQRTHSARTNYLKQWPPLFLPAFKGSARTPLGPKKEEKNNSLPLDLVLVYCTGFNLLIVNTGSFMVLCYLNIWQQCSTLWPQIGLQSHY
jgi:hypothetical protein